MDKIFQRAEDKNVAVRVVYQNDSKLYYDAAFTKEIEAKDMKNLFVKGVVLSVSGTLYAAKSYSEADGIVFANA